MPLLLACLALLAVALRAADRRADAVRVTALKEHVEPLEEYVANEYSENELGGITGLAAEFLGAKLHMSILADLHRAM